RGRKGQKGRRVERVEKRARRHTEYACYFRAAAGFADDRRAVAGVRRTHRRGARRAPLSLGGGLRTADGAVEQRAGALVAGRCFSFPGARPSWRALAVAPRTENVAPLRRPSGGGTPRLSAGALSAGRSHRRLPDAGAVAARPSGAVYA